MNVTARIFAIAISAVVAGCDKPKGTEVGRTITFVERSSGRVNMLTLYGYSGASDRIAFAIFTNIKSENAFSLIVHRHTRVLSGKPPNAKG